MDDVLDGAGAEVVGAGFHSEAIDADGFWFFLSNHVGDMLFSDVVSIDNGGNHGFRDALVVGAELLGVFREAVAAVAKGRVIIMVADARVETNAIDNVFSVEFLRHGVGVEFIEVGDS